MPGHRWNASFKTSERPSQFSNWPAFPLHQPEKLQLGADCSMTLDKSKEVLGWVEGAAAYACWCYHPRRAEATAHYSPRCSPSCSKELIRCLGTSGRRERVHSTTKSAFTSLRDEGKTKPSQGYLRLIRTTESTTTNTTLNRHDLQVENTTAEMVTYIREIPRSVPI